MKFAMPRAGIGAAAAATLAVAGVAVFSSPASAAPVDINYDCQASTPIGNQAANIAQTVDATAPASAAPGSALDVVVDPAPGTVPGDVNGNTIKEIHTFTLKVPVPTNATLTGVDLAGGSGLGDTPPAWSEDGGVITITFEGPIAGGATYELPTVTAHLTAGDSGTIDSSLYGTSYDDPGLSFTAVVSSIIGDIDAPTSCFPNPNPTLTSTTIG